MKILALSSDLGGCFEYRIRMPLESVASQHNEVNYKIATNVDAEAEHHPDGSITVHDVYVEPDTDLIIFQRPSTQKIYSAMSYLHKAGYAIAVDLDDDLSRIEPDHQGYQAYSPRHGSPWHNWQWVVACCQLADMVTYSTAKLRDPRWVDKDPQKSAMVANAIRPSWLRIPRPVLRPDTIGWTGWSAAHPRDLAVANINHKKLNPSKTLHTIGTPAAVAAREMTWGGPMTTHGHDWATFDMYPQQIISSIGLGLVPLVLNPFNQSKSNLKGLEYAALGIPFVSSPTQPYRELAGHGIGTLVYPGNSWTAAINSVSAQADKLGECYRSVIADRHTIDSRSADWYSAWKQAVVNSRRR